MEISGLIVCEIINANQQEGGRTGYKTKPGTRSNVNNNIRQILLNAISRANIIRDRLPEM